MDSRPVGNVMRRGIGVDQQKESRPDSRRPDTQYISIAVAARFLFLCSWSAATLLTSALSPDRQPFEFF